jgi:hypothetical protein
VSRSSSKYVLTLSAAWILGCADPNSCMRNSDCMPDARCTLGTCQVPPPAWDNAGTAGIYVETTVTVVGGSATLIDAGGSAGKSGGSAGKSGGSAGKSTGSGTAGTWVDQAGTEGNVETAGTAGGPTFAGLAGRQ